MSGDDETSKKDDVATGSEKGALVTMVDQDEMEEDEFEGQIEQMIVENGMLIQALMNILLKKGVIAEDEMDQELERLYRELGEDLDDEG